MQRCSTKLATLGRATVRRSSLFVRVAAAVACIVVSLAAPAQAETETSTVLPIAFHVVRVEGTPVVSDEVARGASRTRQRHLRYGWRELRASRDAAARCRARSARERRRSQRAGARTRAGVINCFIVASLRDIDDASQMRSGVHWRSRTHAGAHYVILASIAPLGVLAHELGHFLGNPQHSDSPAP